MGGSSSNLTWWEVSSAVMDAIKKKMQAMKVEKDNAMDRSDVCEQAAKDAKVRAAKAEEEVATTSQKLDDKEKALLAAEMEVNTLNRRVQHLEGDLEVCEDKLLLATQKLDKAATAADDSDRMRKVFESKAAGDEERMAKLEDDLKHVRTKAEEADKQYDEVSKKLQVTESDLERAEERGEMGETKIMELEEELKV